MVASLWFRHDECVNATEELDDTQWKHQHPRGELLENTVKGSLWSFTPLAMIWCKLVNVDVNDPGFKKHEEERTVFCCVTLNVNIPFFMFTRKLHGAPVSGNFSHFGLAFQDELRPPESFVPGITAQCRFQSGAPWLQRAKRSAVLRLSLYPGLCSQRQKRREALPERLRPHGRPPPLGFGPCRWSAWTWRRTAVWRERAERSTVSLRLSKHQLDHYSGFIVSIWGSESEKFISISVLQIVYPGLWNHDTGILLIIIEKIIHM